MRNIIVRHGQDGNLRNGAVTSVDTTGPLVDGGQVRVHVTGVTTSTGNFFSGRGDFSKGIAVGGQIGENN